MSSKKIKDRIAWVTGASSGIGLAVARELVHRGCKVAMTARNASRLEAEVAIMGEGLAFSAPADLTDPEANKRIVASIVERFGGIDIAFLNAGICEYVDVDDFDSDLFQRTMQANFMSMVYGVESVLPELRRSKRPQLIGMSSTARYAGLTRAEAYGASKAAIAYFMESLRLDLHAERIPVSVVSPGFVRTSLTDKNNFPMPMIVEAEKAASIIVNGIERKRNEIRFPKTFALALRLLSALPTSAYLKLMSRTVKAS